MHTLMSDGGSMTVGRRTANYTWGAFEVTLPEGLEQQEPVDDRLQDGYIYRPDDRGHGRAELTFVRADARIDMNASKSDLEQTLDGASERTKGDAYYTRQISGVGLGKLRLGVDVRQGDLVRVLLWSKYLELPVTAIIPGKSADGSTPDMAAQVGGQMLRDAELLSKRNSEIDTAIAVEKRTRLNQVGAVDSKATQAKDTAEAATGALAGPGASPDDVTQGMSELAQQMQTNDEQAPVGLIDAYMQANDERWRMQVEINEATDAALIAHGAAIEANEKAIKSLMRGVAGFMHVPTDAGSWSDDRIEVTRSGGTVAVTALDRWRGTVAFSGSHTGQDGVVTPVIRGSTVPDSGGREYSFHSSGQSIVHYLVNPGVVEEREIANLPVQTLANREWVTVLAWDVPEDTDLMVVAKWVWVAKTYGGDYWGRIVVNGVDVTDVYTSASAPLFGHGRRVAQVSTQWVEAKSGDVVEVQAQAGHGNSTNRRVDSVRANITTVTDEA